MIYLLRRARIFSEKEKENVVESTTATHIRTANNIAISKSVDLFVIKKIAGCRFF
jgi:hypothetical protein